MKNCKLTITTTIEGRTTEIVRDAYAQFTPLRTHVSYTEENAAVTITLEEGCLHIERQGDYTQSLHFKEGEMLESKLGILGTEGVIYTQTTRLSYSLSETSLLLSLHYALHTGDEPQIVKLRLFAKRIA